MNEKTWQIQYGRKASLIVKKISKIWKKNKLNSEMIWKMWKKGKLNSDKTWTNMEEMQVE